MNRYKYNNVKRGKSMKKIIYSFIILVLAGIILGAAGKDDKQTARLKIGKVTVDGLNVRAGVGINYEIVGRLRFGENVIIEERISYPNVAVWLKIKAPKNVRLYVAQQFVEKLSNNKGRIKENNVNIRAGASLKSTIVNQVNKGTQINIIRKVGDFYEISPPPNTSLYIAEEFVDIIGDYVETNNKTKGKIALSENEWFSKFNSIILKITEEHEKDISIRDYNRYILELQGLEKLAPTSQLKNKALERIAVLEELQKGVEKIRIKEQELEKKRVENLVASADKTLSKEIPTFVTPQPHPVEEEYSYKASGYLEGVGLYFGRPAPYKLINNRHIVCFIKTEKNLKKYLGKFVEVKGRNYQDSKGRNILELTDIKVIDDTF